MKTTAIVTTVWGLLLIIGGVMGGLEAGSHVSLIAGGASGILALAAAAFMVKQQPAGLVIALVLAILLALFGFGTWLGAGKNFMPRGVIGILSLVEILAVVPALRKPALAPPAVPHLDAES